jgi:hypothetical protein
MIYLASQHPSASPDLKVMANRMPANMWYNGIHLFLELLKNQFPVSLEYMLYFVYKAYFIITFFLKSVPDFEKNID